MICQRAEQDEALGADCVCVCMCVECSCRTGTQICVERVCAHVPAGNTHWAPGPAGTCSQGPAAALPLLGHQICQPVIVTCALGPAVGLEPRIASAKTIQLPEQKDWKRENGAFNAFKLTNSLSVKAGWWQAAKSSIPAPRHIHLATLLGSATPEMTKLLPMASNCSETSHGYDAWTGCFSTNLSPQQAQPEGCAETSPLQKLCHPDTGGSWHKACVGQLSRLKCEHISRAEVPSVKGKSTSRAEAFKALGTHKIYFWQIICSLSSFSHATQSCCGGIPWSSPVSPSKYNKLQALKSFWHSLSDCRGTRWWII